MRLLQKKTNWRVSFIFSLFIGSVLGQSYSEGFENLANLTDWYIQNNSALPDQDWGAGDNTIFPAQAGTSGSYLSVNFQSTLSSSATTISNWLFTPTRTYNNGDVITFYSRTVTGPLYPDRMEVRFSNDGNGLDCGTNPTDVGTFTTLLLTINPTLTTTGYPQAWTQYTINISGLAGPTNGRVAFRYFVVNAGPGGINSDYIGLDSYTYSSVGSSPSNDQCSGAITLNQGTSCNPVSGTVAYATESQVGCAGTANNDVWYSFVANSTGASITVNGTPLFDAVYQVFSGNCANLTSLSCVDSGTEGEIEAGIVNNLTIGQTYYIRVHDWLDDIPNTMNFGICVEQFTQCNLQQPIGSILETESCGADLNGGCNATPVSYQQIICGDTIFGSSWADNGNRDLDWYQFQLVTPVNVTWSATAEFPYYLYIVDVSDCAQPVILASTNFNACESGSISYNPGIAGNYAVVIAPATFSGYSCNSGNINYVASLNLPSSPNQLTSSASSFCLGDSILISGSANTSYTWFLNGNQIGVGQTWNATQTGTYTAAFMDLNSCSSVTNVLTLNSLQLDDASFTYPSNTVCIGSSNLFPNSVYSGSYSSDLAGLVFANILTGEIDMTQSLEGSYQITFTTDSVCPNSSTQNFVITSSPSASFFYADSMVCVNSANLQPILNPTSSIGAFSSNSNLISISTSTGEIDLSNSEIGSYTIYNSIPSSGVCQEQVDSTEVIILGTALVFPPVNSLCPSNQLVQLQATPSGGTFSGTSIENNEFNTSLGSCDVTYSFLDTNGCTNTSSQTIQVDTIPTLSFGNYNSVCSSDGTFNLNLGSPAGGVYVGSGVQNNQFNPSQGIIGSNNLQYIYTTQNGCSDSISGVVVVNESPTVTFDPLPAICDTIAVFALGGVSPIGGTFSGNGVVGATFDPVLSGVGTHSITYTYSNSGCSSSQTQSIIVDNCSSVDELVELLSIFPNPSDGNFTIFGEGISSVKCFTLDGKVLSYSIDIIALNKISIQLEEPSGTYIIQIIKSGKSLYFPLIVNQ
jgi:hypothetical protein